MICLEVLSHKVKKYTDKDLAAHSTIIYHRRKCLYGNDIKDVFGAVSKKDYFDSIWSDIEEAETEIMDNPTYIILNLCRVLAYKKEELILSKQEGGKWGIWGYGDLRVVSGEAPDTCGSAHRCRCIRPLMRPPALRRLNPDISTAGLC